VTIESRFWRRPGLGSGLLLGWLAGALSFPASAAGQIPTQLLPDRPRSVLLVDDYDLNRPVWQLTFGGIQERIQEDIDNVVFYTETLDVQQFSDPELLAEGERWLVQKYAGRRLDLLVGHGERSLDALKSLREAAGWDIPLLYLRADGGRPLDVEELPQISNGTSMLLGSLEAEMARVIQVLLPETRTLVLVVDSEAEAAGLLNRFRSHVPQSMTLILLVRPNHARVDAVVRASGPNVALYYTLVLQDEDGRPWAPQDYLRALTERVSAPVFTPFTSQLGTGTLGGVQANPALMGRSVGAVMVDLLSSIEPASVQPSTFDSWSLSLDWGSARRHGISPNRVPANVIWVGKPDRFWEAFPRTTGVLAGVFLLLLGTGFNLAASRRSVERARDARSRLAQRLMAVVDGDRSRVARDLHDDLCQELTVVALELDRTQPSAGERVRDLISKTRAIAHDLHAAPLDRIPFQDAVVALARNVEAAAAASGTADEQASSLKVTVEPVNWPIGVPQDVALNLYRAIQESLQNVVRHSKARTCVIRLEGLVNAYRVVIVDDGVGFLAQPSEDLGLGLVGMRERMVSLNGSLRVRSGAGKGTEVELVVPHRSLAEASSVQ